MTSPSEKINLNRSVTVNFQNVSSKTLTRTSGDFMTTWGLTSVQAPTTIQPGQTVQWEEKTTAISNIPRAEADYSFDGGSLSVWWENPISGSNQYGVSCDPQGPFLIGYSGGSGTNATINVGFYEIGDNLSWWYLWDELNSQSVFTATGDNSVAMSALVSDDSQLWSFVVPIIGGLDHQWSGTSKIINKKYNKFLTAYSWSNNNLGLWLGNDGADQYWDLAWQDEFPGLLKNKNCGLYLTRPRSGGGLVVVESLDGNDEYMATQNWITSQPSGFGSNSGGNGNGNGNGNDGNLGHNHGQDGGP